MPVHPYRTRIRVSGTAVSTGGSQALVGCVNTASAAFSHREGSMVTRVAIKSRGPRNTHREVPPAGQPRHMHACGCVLAFADKRLIKLADQY